jgi:DNA-binding CsgD family transcriptional regulator
VSLTTQRPATHRATVHRPAVPAPSLPPPSLPSSAPLSALSPRERLILRRLEADRTLAQIAAELFVSRNTVKTQVQSVYRKLGVRRRADAVALARDLRLG